MFLFNSTKKFWLLLISLVVMFNLFYFWLQERNFEKLQKNQSKALGISFLGRESKFSSISHKLSKTSEPLELFIFIISSSNYNRMQLRKTMLQLSKSRFET